MIRRKRWFSILSILLTIAVVAGSFYPVSGIVPLEASGPEDSIQASAGMPGEEIISERTENAKKFDLGDGRYALDVSLGAIHYKDNYSDEKEQWKDIDLTFDENNRINKAPYILTVDPDNKSFTVYDKKTGNTSSVKLNKVGDKDIQDMPDLNAKNAEISRGKILWSDVDTDLDLSITADNTRVSFDWVVKSEKAPHEVEFEVEDGGILIIYQGVDADGEPVDVVASKNGNMVTESIEKGGTYPKVINPTIDVDTGASADDCRVRWDGSSWVIDVASGAATAGYLTGGYTKLGCGFRFPGITIPANSTINSSYISLASPSNCTGTGTNTRITGDKEDDPAVWSTIANYQARRGTVVGGANNNYITTAQVSWDNIVDWYYPNWYNSPDISSVIQELIDANAPNNEALALFWDDHDNRSSNYRNGYAWDNGSGSHAPQLHIEYIIPPEPPTNVSATDGEYTDEIDISWTESSGATDYKIYRNVMNESNAASLIGTSTSSSYDDTSTVPWATYYYWVQACNSAAESDLSDEDTGWINLSSAVEP
jgi:hypothetical protein